MRNNPTAIELAFQALPLSVLDTPLGKRVLSILMSREKRRKSPEGWHANLSYRTFHKLQAQGVMQ